MLREVSDTEDSFSADDEDEVGRGVEEAKEHPPLLPINPSAPTISTSAGGPAQQATAVEGEGGKTEEAANPQEEDKGDLEMAPVYLKKLLPVYTELFHSSLAPAVRGGCVCVGGGGESLFQHVSALL